MRASFLAEDYSDEKLAAMLQQSHPEILRKIIELMPTNQPIHERLQLAHTALVACNLIVATNNALATETRIQSATSDDDDAGGRPL